MRCPRCQRASPDDAVFCPGCGAPLAFRSEPAPRPLDLSISLDRRAPGREAMLATSLDEPGSARWDLAPAPEPATFRRAPLPAIDADDDLEFGPIPELAPELEPGTVQGLATRDAPDPEAFEQGRAFVLRDPAHSGPELAAFAGSDRGTLSGPEAGALSSPGPATLAGPEPAILAGSEAAFDPAPVEPASFDGDRTFAHALGLAPDPVIPEDLGLAPDDEPGSAPGAPELLRRLRGAPQRAGLAPEVELGLALDDRPGPGEERDLDLALPPSAQPAQLPLPLREKGPRLRPARPARRAAAWAVDAAPLALLWVGALAALYDRVPLSPGDRAGLLERVLRDGGALALPLLAGVATLALVHQTLAHALAGATLGKRLLGLRVVSEDGERPSVERCAARAALSAASVLLLGLGLLPALFTRSGRALHDISAGTRVVEAP